MQFQVPQFIDTEDKIVGPFSLKQFAYVGVAALISALFYFFTEPWLWAIVSIMVFGVAFALAFVKIEGRPFANVVLSAFNFYWKPQTYIWQPEHPAVHLSQEKVKAEQGRSALEEILAKSAAKTRTVIKSAPSRAASVFAPKSRDVAPAESAHPQVQVKSEAAAEPTATIAAVTKPTTVSREAVSVGSALHKSWENVQTGAPLSDKESDKQFLEQRMMERYQIFRRATGDRQASKRVDYR